MPRGGPRRGKARSASVPEIDRRAKLVSLRLDPETRARLDAAAEVYGSRTRALVAGLDALGIESPPAGR